MKLIISRFFKSICCIWIVTIASSSFIWAKTYNIGIIQDGTYENYKKIKRSIKQELETISEGQFTISYPDASQLNGEFNVEKIQAYAKQMANDPNLDLIFSVGHESSKYFINIHPLKTPVVAVKVESPVLLGFINPVNMKPHNPNWTTSYDATAEASIMFTLNELVKFKKIAFITTDFFYQNNHSLSVKVADKNYTRVSGKLKLKGKTLKIRAIPDQSSPIIAEIKNGVQFHPIIGEYQDWLLLPEGWAKKSSVRIIKKTYIKSSSQKRTIEQVINDNSLSIGFGIEAIAVNRKNYREKVALVEADAVFVSELYQFTDAQVKEIYSLLADKKIVTISGTGVDGVEKGALFSAWKDNYEEIGRIFALKGYSILSGTPTSEISTVDKFNLELTFNMDTARKINFNIPVKYLYEDNLYEAENDARKLTIKEATELALRDNYIIRISEEQARQTESQIGVVRGTLLPQLSSNVTATQIDDERADLSEGTTESETVLNVTLSQKIWDSAAFEALEAAELARNISHTSVDITKADLTQNVIQAYMDVLQAKEILKTRREHLKAFRNLKEIAQLKYELQATGKNDVLQVDSQYDDARIQLTSAIEDWSSKMVTLNNLLNLPRGTRLSLADLSIQNKGFKEKEFVFNRLTTTLDLKEFGKMIDKRVLSASYQLLSAEQLLEKALLEKEQVTSEFVPSVSMGATWFRQLADKHKEYTGDQAGVNEDAYDDRKKTGWSASLTLTVPIFNGGKRFSQLDAANQKIAEYTYNRDKVKADLLKDSRILQNSFFNNQRRVHITGNMLKTSKESFQLGQVSYQEGSTSMSDLLTLQTNLISTEISMVTVRYQLFKSIIKMLRMVNHLDVLTQSAEQIKNDPLLIELEEYLNSKP